MTNLSPHPFVALLVVSATQLAYAAPVPDKVLADYGGMYSTSCADPKALRARIEKIGMTIARGDRTVTGTFEMEALTYLGQSPPEGYETALISNVKGVGSMVFILYRGRHGLELDLDTDDPVLKKIGIVKRGNVKYKKC